MLFKCLAMFFWYSSPQWFSSDKISGYCEVANAYGFIPLVRTSLNNIEDVRVPPWCISGPSSPPPSQQSTKGSSCFAQSDTRMIIFTSIQAYARHNGSPSAMQTCIVQHYCHLSPGFRISSYKGRFV